ncbi:MAG: hypothetical protein U9Q29_01740 [Campylobacterota bacterium]|nr:hypothetical protein [Campylobacterota bacterium]
MFRNMKALIIAFIAITLMFGCKGPPRPGFHRAPPHRVAPEPEMSADEKAQRASDRALDKLDNE